VGAIFGAAAVSNVCGNTRAKISIHYTLRYMQQQQKKSNGKFSRNKKLEIKNSLKSNIQN